MIPHERPPYVINENLQIIQEMGSICSIQENKHLYFVDTDVLGALKHTFFTKETNSDTHFTTC
jgi:hypothetical protein